MSNELGYRLENLQLPNRIKQHDGHGVRISEDARARIVNAVFTILKNMGQAIGKPIANLAEKIVDKKIASIDAEIKKDQDKRLSYISFRDVQRNEFTLTERIKKLKNDKNNLIAHLDTIKRICGQAQGISIQSKESKEVTGLGSYIKSTFAYNWFFTKNKGLEKQFDDKLNNAFNQPEIPNQNEPEIPEIPNQNEPEIPVIPEPTAPIEAPAVPEEPVIREPIGIPAIPAAIEPQPVQDFPTQINPIVVPEEPIKQVDAAPAAKEEQPEQNNQDANDLISQAVKMIKKLTQRVNELETGKKAVEDQFESYRTETQERIEVLEDDFKDSLFQVEIREDALKAKKVEADAKDAENASLRTQVEGLTTENGDLKIKVDDFEADNNDLQAEVSNLTLENRGLQAEINRLTLENGNLRRTNIVGLSQLKELLNNENVLDEVSKAEQGIAVK